MRSVLRVAVLGFLSTAACGSTSAKSNASLDASDEYMSEGCADPAPATCGSCCGIAQQPHCMDGAWQCPSPLLCLCGGAPSDAASGDASTVASDGQATLFAIPFTLEPSGGCLPQPLPSDGKSGTLCRILLSGVVGGCQQPGLSPAAPEDVSKIDESFMAVDASPPLTSTLCAITQLPAAAMGGAGCADPATPGWCYVEGSCSADAGSSCQQNICPTAAYESESLVYAGASLICP